MLGVLRGGVGGCFWVVLWTLNSQKIACSFPKIIVLLLVCRIFCNFAAFERRHFRHSLIPRETIERVCATAKIEEVVGDYVTLKRRGANMIGLCPFHDEKTGSFTVSPSKGIFKCFGCGKAGHTVGFVMEIEQCSYIEAIRLLAKKYHIEIEERDLTPEEQQRQDDRESMFVVNDFANKWFQNQLWTTDEGNVVGMSYLRTRGLREDIIRKFQIGYSPERATLWREAKQAGYQEKYLLNDAEHEPHIGTGLCLKGEKGDLYDRFRGRVIFPFFSASGRVVGFAGRMIKKSDKAGKYVNSPTSTLFEKHNELYGLYQAKQAISKQGCCYLVEGQLDVIQMVQSGIENVVASGGTSLTMPQVRLMHRYTENITILYDGDKAGVKAALRGIDMILEEGINVKVVLLPDGEDPDSFAKSHNASDFIAFIEANQCDFVRFKTRLLSSEAGDDPVKRVDMINQIVQSIAVIPDIIKRQVYIKDSASFLGMQEDILTRKVIEVRKQQFAEKNKEKERAARREQTAAEPAMPATNGTPTPADSQAATPATVVHTGLSNKEENMQNLVQVIVRYGEQPLFVNEDGTICQAGEYIISELTQDCIEITNPLYSKIIEEYNAHHADEGFVAANFFQYHPDVEVSRLAVNLIADKYQLSAIYNQQSVSENVVQEVKPQTDADILPELVPRLLLELKYTIVNERIDAMQVMLRDAQSRNDWELMRTILAQQPQLLEIRRQLCAALGNRVVTK